MPFLFKRSSRNAIFSRLLMVAIATSNFMNELYNSEFWHEFSVLMLKETIAQFHIYFSASFARFLSIIYKYIYKYMDMYIMQNVSQ